MAANNKAEKTDYLSERIAQNENFQSIDINKWAFEKIQGSDKLLNVLELCCGTGKQTKYLLGAFPKSTISCLDISPEAIDVVKANNKTDENRMRFFNTGIDSFFSNNKENYDIIFCSYGLYYSSNIEFVLSSIMQSLNPEGRFIVMGPYGNNNKQLFSLVLGLNIPIAEPVMHSSSQFMIRNVLAFSATNFREIHVYTTRNSVKWLNADSVVSYWQSSTFFEEDKKEDFALRVKEEIEKNHEFVNDKHIMLIQAINH